MMTTGRSHLHSSFRRMPAFAGMALIRAYQLTLSGLIGRQCRHLPSCSAYTSESIGRFGLWAGGWMGLARICRCHPWGTHGLDFPPLQRPARARWWAPWRYGRWRGVQDRASRDRSDVGQDAGERARPDFRCD